MLVIRDSCFYLLRISFLDAHRQFFTTRLYIPGFLFSYYFKNRKPELPEKYLSSDSKTAILALPQCIPSCVIWESLPSSFWKKKKEVVGEGGEVGKSLTFDEFSQPLSTLAAFTPIPPSSLKITLPSKTPLRSP